MTKPQVKIVDTNTGEEVIRDANTEELAQIEADKVEAENAKALETAKAHERAALLERLNVTEDEARLLLGGN